MNKWLAGSPHQNHYHIEYLQIIIADSLVPVTILTMLIINLWPFIPEIANHRVTTPTVKIPLSKKNQLIIFPAMIYAASDSQYIVVVKA